MAFDNTKMNFGPSSGSTNVKMVCYGVAADALATIEADGYFDTVAGKFNTGDFLAVAASDGHALYEVTKTTGDIALTKIASTALGALSALAGTLTGTITGTMADVSALSTSDTYTDAAVNAKITAVNLQLKELQTKVNAIIAAV